MLAAPKSRKIHKSGSFYTRLYGIHIYNKSTTFLAETPSHWQRLMQFVHTFDMAAWSWISGIIQEGLKLNWYLKLWGGQGELKKKRRKQRGRWESLAVEVVVTILEECAFSACGRCRSCAWTCSGWTRVRRRTGKSDREQRECGCYKHIAPGMSKEACTATVILSVVHLQIMHLYVHLILLAIAKAFLIYRILSRGFIENYNSAKCEWCKFSSTVRICYSGGLWISKIYHYNRCIITSDVHSLRSNREHLLPACAYPWKIHKIPSSMSCRVVFEHFSL